MAITTLNIDNFGGELVRDNPTYTIRDDNSLNNLTVSKTSLCGSKFTAGHSHKGLDEVYYFIKGNGIMRIDNEYTIVKSGDIVLVPGGAFHQVINSHESQKLDFICVFQKYDRNDSSATYNNK
jgi:mannose-6-phosphate isomerase-like protein (cupin superfamily)